MSRKRYLSTNISVDPRVRDLASQSGEFAALLYTWMIPHADDEGVITANADELLLQVVPGFRWRTAEDVSAAIEEMERLGLVECVGENRLRFPSKPFYKYQAYIGSTRRSAKVESGDSEAPETGSAEQRESAQNGATSRNAPKSAQNPASFKSSSSVNSPETPPVSPEGTERRATPKPKPERVPITEADTEELVAKYAERYGSPLAVRDEIELALNHQARFKNLNERLYVDGWLRRELNHRPARLVPNGRTMVPAAPARHVIDRTGVQN